MNPFNTAFGNYYFGFRYFGEINALLKTKTVFNDTRNARTKGVGLASDTRGGRTQGFGITNDTRSARTVGKYPPTQYTDLYVPQGTPYVDDENV